MSSLIPDYLIIVYFVADLMFMFGFVVLFVISKSIPEDGYTKEKKYMGRWKNFEKYIKDSSLIKERPPASVQLWRRYVIYVAALGCADEVTKNMKKNILNPWIC